MCMCVCVHLYETTKGGSRYSMARQKNYRERVKGERTFNNSWSASDVISYSSGVVSISPDESLIYNYLRFSPASMKLPFGNGAEGKQTADGRSIEWAGSGESSSGNCTSLWMGENGCTVRYDLSRI